MTMTARQRGRAFILGEAAPAVSVGPMDRMGCALDRLLGTTSQQLARAFESFSPPTASRLRQQYSGVIEAHRANPQLRAESLMEIYSFVTGHDDLGAHVVESQVSVDWANILGSALNRALLTAYSEADFGERSLYQPAIAQDLRTQHVLGVDEHGDLPTVDPEVADYVEATKLADWDSTYAMLQKGLILSLSRKTILNNDVAAVARVVQSLGRAARRTVAREVWALWTANTTYVPDGVAWFNSAHGGNTGTTALGAAGVKAAILKLLDQTQAGNAEKMGTRVRRGSLWLTVPTALWDTAYGLNQTVSDALYHLFGADNENIIVNPLLTDATDWGVHRDSSEVESIRVSFLNGREEPELLLADTKNAGQMFTGDRLQYKMRYEFGVGLVEFRGAFKSVVAG